VDEASVIARLLGLKLLRVRAHVTLHPADLESITYLDACAVQQRPAQPTEGGNLSDPVELLARASRTMHDTKRISF
jgi:hypothetical protein